jgi:hypothetical protein
MKNQNAEQNYARFSVNPDRIDGAVHNTATARLGVGFNYNAMEQIDAVEIAFANEPHGNVRSVMVVDMAAAKALRDRLDAVLAEQAANVRRARRHRATKTYPVKRGDGRVVNVTIPEE